MLNGPAPRLAIYRNAKQYSIGELAPIQDGPDASRHVRREIRDHHFSARNERSQTRQESDGDQNAANQFDHAGHPQLRSNWHDLAAERAEQLLSAVECEQHPNDNAEGCIDRIG